MLFEHIPTPRTDAEDYIAFEAVNRVMRELQSYPAGVPLERIIEFLESDYENWKDIMLIILDEENIVVEDNMLRLRPALKW